MVALLIAVTLATVLGLGAYLATLGVAAERANLHRLDAAIAARRAEITALRRDYGIRSRMLQLERWSHDLDLQPAALGQIVAPGAPLLPAARERAAQLAAETAPVDAGPHRGYAPAARDDLDALVGAVSGG